MISDLSGAVDALPSTADVTVAEIPFRILRTHVPAGYRKPRPEPMLVSLPVMLRHVPGPGVAVAAWHVTPAGRERSAILVDGGGQHYAPVSLRIGQTIGEREFSTILDDPARSHLLGIAGIGRGPNLPMADEVRSRSIVDDGLAAAGLLAATLSDTLALIDGKVHASIDPPCVSIQFPAAEPARLYKVAALLQRGLPGRTAALRLPPGTATGPYEGVLVALGRNGSTPEGRKLLPGDRPHAFGFRELREDMMRTLPWVHGLEDFVFRSSAEIRAQAAFQGLLDRPPAGEDRVIVEGLLDGLETLVGATKTPLGVSTLVLFRERLRSLR